MKMLAKMRTQTQMNKNLMLNSSRMKKMHKLVNPLKKTFPTIWR